MAVVPLGEASPGAAISCFVAQFPLSFVGLADVFDTCTGASPIPQPPQEEPFS